MFYHSLVNVYNFSVVIDHLMLVINNKLETNPDLNSQIQVLDSTCTELKCLTCGGPRSEPSVSPTGHWPRLPASTPSGSRLRSAGVETPLQREAEVRRGHTGRKRHR